MKDKPMTQMKDDDGKIYNYGIPDLLHHKIKSIRQKGQIEYLEAKIDLALSIVSNIVETIVDDKKALSIFDIDDLQILKDSDRASTNSGYRIELYENGVMLEKDNAKQAIANIIELVSKEFMKSRSSFQHFNVDKFVESLLKILSPE